MADKNFLEEEPQTEEEYEIAFAQMLAEMQRLRAIMDSDRTEINSLRAEIAALKSESATLRAETRAILASLKGAVSDGDDTPSGQRLH